VGAKVKPVSVQPATALPGFARSQPAVRTARVTWKPVGAKVKPVSVQPATALPGFARSQPAVRTARVIWTPEIPTVEPVPVHPETVHPTPNRPLTEVPDGVGTVWSFHAVPFHVSA
jgi:hypothetical protein